MDRHSNQLTRRGFLTRMAVSATSITIAEFAHAGNILAENDASGQKQLLPHYVAGILTRISAGSMTVTAPGYDPNVLVLFRTDTDFCRGSCGLSWQSLKLGDRIDTYTYDDALGVRTALWVNANMIASWGCVDAINGNVLTLSPMTGRPGPVRELTIHPYTTVVVGDIIDKGRADIFRVEDMIHYTACADVPDLGVRHIMGGAVHRLEPVGAS